MIYSGEQADDISSPARAYAKICVIGAGAWGTALASVARRAGRKTAIWGRDQEAIFRILHQGADVKETFSDFWSRPIEGERRGLAISIDHPVTMATEAVQ